MGCVRTAMGVWSIGFGFRMASIFLVAKDGGLWEAFPCKCTVKE
jgi:hypothetical protein